MVRVLRLPLTAVGLVALVAVAGGAAQRHWHSIPTRTYGAGLNSCAAWTKASDGPHRAANAEWVMGYVSAISDVDGFRFAAGQVPRALESTAPEDVQRFVDKYCLDRPSHPLVAAAHAFVATLGHEWPTPPVPVREYR